MTTQSSWAKAPPAVANALKLASDWEDEGGPEDSAQRGFALAITVPSSWRAGDVLAAFSPVADVRAVDTVLVDAYGVAIVKFFKVQGEEAVRAMGEVCGGEPIVLRRSEWASVHKVSATVVVGSQEAWPFHRALEVCAPHGACTALRIAGTKTVADFADVREAVKCRRALREQYRPPAPPPAPAPPALPVSHDISVEAVQSGDDPRRTCVVHNVPSTCTRKDLTDMIDKVVPNRYDILALPTLPFRTGNAGFAFVSFLDQQAVALFFLAFHGLQLGTCKPLEVQYSKVQGSRRILKTWGRLDPEAAGGEMLLDGRRGPLSCVTEEQSDVESAKAEWSLGLAGQ
mmetsp:Transcript_49426/g.112265  ORF Transcript_49426/g.112265 Transcript_49426/m.112265 type:complete len:343 (+) Transcript_49426:31-1059(+)